MVLLGKRRFAKFAEVFGTISLKAQGSSYKSSHEKHDWNTKQRLVKKQESKKWGHQLTSILHLSITSRRMNKKKTCVFHLVAIHTLLRKDLF
ncbi:hypothetical protein AVEN_217948-1 [Araneus ventricosus]|uniref:Uncharacterized protein n=1 Tax=Araneus ventricosus TaxID=182803 RepID=A0A4Y2VRA4_ARAVE|nr:hypothetical protein AVEN_217948-1 [Araneus ventricosus]